VRQLNLWPIRQYIHEFSWQHRAFLVLQIICGLVTWYLWKHLPNPGWAVALLAFVAASMSIHGDMHGWQKAIWMCIIGALLVIELRSINTDRFIRDQQAIADRSMQEAEFKATAGGLKAAIVGIDSTLKTANTTLLQTRPKAAIRFMGFEWANQIPAQVNAGETYWFNY